MAICPICRADFEALRAGQHSCSARCGQILGGLRVQRARRRREQIHHLERCAHNRHEWSREFHSHEGLHEGRGMDPNYTPLL